MKKRILTFIISSFTVAAIAQTTSTTTTPKLPIDSVTKKITYTEVVQQKGTKDTLYNRAIHWCNIFFKNAQDVTKVRDKESGKVEGISRFKVYNAPLKDGTKTDGGIVSFTFTIENKDNKYRYTITKFNMKSISLQPLEKWMNKKDPDYSPQWDDYLAQVDKYMQDFTKSLKKGMMEAKKVNDNW
ncbi:MAG: DUF4468 domain-containing protein [Bacteroidales bacterium]